MRVTLLAAIILFPLTLAAQQPGEVATRCASLTSLKLADARVTSAGVVAAAASIPDAKLPAPAAFCRVKIVDTPTSDSNILTEVWFPVSGWNGSFHGIGNGGFAGSLYYGEMAAAVAQGYATAGTDTGHSGGPEFALGHPEKVKDFGWRAIHDMSVQAKQAAAAFYGKPAAHAYFTACSDGGREALMEAQRFPADYDGILAGAPAYHWTALIATGATNAKTLLATPETYIPGTKIPALAAAVLKQCDTLDGVADGVLNDPRACHFDPAAIVCKRGTDTDACLTPRQIASLQTLYAANRDARGKIVYPGMLPGGEAGKEGWVRWITGDKPGNSLGAFFPLGYFANFVYQLPGWSLQSADFAKDLKQADETTGKALNAVDTNLQPFAGRGGKLILYHGWDDPAIPAEGTIEYYTAAAATLGDKAKGSLRLYMVPGMQHCGGGPGATDFGQSTTEARGDAQHDIFTALEQWVERDEAPAVITAKGDTFTRLLCPYPLTAMYTGGNQNDAMSFTCGATGP